MAIYFFQIFTGVVTYKCIASRLLLFKPYFFMILYHTTWLIINSYLLDLFFWFFMLGVFK